MKKMLMLFLGIVFTGAVFSQTFMNGAGIGTAVAITENEDVAAYAVFSYSPRVSFLQGENTSVSIGVPLSVGLGGSYSSYSSSYYSEETNTLVFMIKVPVIIDFNVGAGAHKETEKRFGFFIGGGMALFYGSFYGEFYDAVNGYYDYGKTIVTSFGPAANAGFRIAVGRNQKNIETKFSFMKGLNDAKPVVFGLGVAFNF